MSEFQLNSRQVAYEVLFEVDEHDGYANLVLPQLLKESELRGRDAGFATELAYGTLRMRGFYNAVIEAAAGRPVTEIMPTVVRLLQLGAHQVLAMRVSPHAAVSETVSLVKQLENEGAAKFANAVMRRITERTTEQWLDRVAPGDSVDDLAVRYSHPAWVVHALRGALKADGREDELVALLEADNLPPKVTLVARPGLIERDALVLEGARSGATPTRWSPVGATLDGGDPGVIRAVKSGTAAVQDEGSQVVALALTAAELVGGTGPELWLDMCAGPGGKAALLGAMAAQKRATVDALEIHEHRADLVERSVRALPHGVVRVIVGDGRTFGEDASYDRILLDAPCTGLGALRRRAEARWRRVPSDVTELAELQSALLASAARLLRPGGVVAYVTCSPVIEESLSIVAGDHGLEQLDSREAVAKVTRTDAAEWGDGPHVQMWPHAHGTDAMFISLLRKPVAPNPETQEIMSNSPCALCASTDSIVNVVVEPRDSRVALCGTCASQYAGGAPDEAHLRCLMESAWTQEPAEQVVVVRILDRMTEFQWAADLREQLYLEDDVLAWANDAGDDWDAGTDATPTDSQGAEIADGDTVTLIKDLVVKGGGFTAKRGTSVKGVRVGTDPTHVEGRVNGQTIMLKTEFLKRVQA